MYCTYYYDKKFGQKSKKLAELISRLMYKFATLGINLKDENQFVWKINRYGKTLQVYNVYGVCVAEIKKV